MIFQQENFTFWRFYFKHSRISTSDEDFVFTRVLLRTIDDFLFIRVFLRAIWRFYFIYSRISTSNCFDKKFDRMSINLAKFRTRNRVLETMNYRHCWLIKRFRVEDVRSSRIESSCFVLLVDDENECEIYIVCYDENQI